MKLTQNIVCWLATTVLATFLAACGGGSDSGGGGGGNPFAGSYNGMATITLTAPGAAPQTASGTISFRIDPDGTVISDPGRDFSGTGTLNGNTFVITLGPQNLQPPGMSCVGSVKLSGSVTGNTISGRFSSTGFSCNGVPIKWTGSFSATRIAGAAVVRASNPVMGAVRITLQSMQ